MKTFVKIFNFLTSPDDAEEGASMVEYGLLVGLIAVVVVAATTAVGVEIRSLFNNVVNALPG